MFNFLKKSKTDNSTSPMVTKDGLRVGGQTLKPDVIVNSIIDGVVLIDGEKLIHFFNKAAADITGWAQTDAQKLAFDTVLKLTNAKGEPYRPVDNPIMKVLAKGQSVRDNNSQLVTRSGKRIAISLIVSPIGGNDSAAQGVVGVFRDITQEKTEEQQRNDFISTASHEMRTPLAAIEGYLSLALNDKITKLDNTARSYVQKAHAATQHLGVLFQDLLTSSKAEDGRLSSNPVVVEIGEAVEQTVDAARFNAQSKGLQLKYELSSSQAQAPAAKVMRPLYYVFADPHRLREVLQNVIDNAIKYTMSGSVTVSLTGDQTVVQIQVKDPGPGIAAEDLSHLFQKFYRVDSSLTRSIGGTGLGLFICRKILELYNGRIWAESQVGKGSTFFINLPRLSAEQAAAAQKKQASQMSVLDSDAFK